MSRSHKDDLVERVMQQVQELPDRSSPDDQPEMMLVSVQELEDILRECLGNYQLLPWSKM